MRNLNLNIKCLYCEHTNPLSNEPFIKIKDNNQGENIEQIVHKYLEVGQRSVNSCCSLHGQKYGLIDNQNILFIIFEEPRNIDPTGKCKIGKQIFHYSSHDCETKEEKPEYLSNFSYNKYILHKQNETILISTRENYIKNIKMVVLIKEVINNTPSAISPYEKRAVL